jgi:hypothetical protein
MNNDWTTWNKYWYSMWYQYYLKNYADAWKALNNYLMSKGASKAIKKEPIQEKTVQKSVLRVSDYTATDLSEKDLQEIITRVGSKVENIYELTPGQRWMLGDADRVTSEFFLQYLFRAYIHLEPYKLRQKLEEVCEKRDNLRSAYLRRGLSKPYRVVLKNRQAELKFEDLSDLTDEALEEKLKSIMDADRRRGFDLEKDSLLRITVYKTGAENTYAILMSQPHINTDGMSMMLLLKDIFVDYALETAGLLEQFGKHLPEVSYEEYAKWLESRDREGELEYWKQVLKGMTKHTKVPGALGDMKGEPVISQMSLTFSKDTQIGLKEKQSAFKATANSLMQAAWSILLMRMYHTKDVTFGAITSGREAQVQKSSMMTGGFVNAIPVRACIDSGEMSVSDFVKSLQNQFMTSLSYAHCSPGEIAEAVGLEDSIFDHLLNFHNFDSMVPSGSFSGSANLPGIRMIESKLFDNLSKDLTIYFQNRKDGLSCNFVYDKRKFSDARIKILMTQFEHVTDQIAQGEDSILIEDISCSDMRVFEGVNKDEQALFEEIVSFISALPVFADTSMTDIQKLARYAKVQEYLADDMIISERSQIHDLMFVFDGGVEIHRKAADGWTHTLRIMKRGAMITVSGLWDDEHIYFGARAYKRGTRVLSVPGTAVRSMMNTNGSVGINIMKGLDRQAASLSLLWINQD